MQISAGKTYTTLPENSPAKLLNTIICQTVLLVPKSETVTVNPTSEEIRTGFRPYRSAIRPQKIIVNICTIEKIDSYLTSKLKSMYQKEWGIVVEVATQIYNEGEARTITPV
jgi:hypothetical protein